MRIYGLRIKSKALFLQCLLCGRACSIKPARAELVCKIMLMLLNNSCTECLSRSLSLSQLKGGCSPAGDGEQWDVTGSGYKDVLSLFVLCLVCMTFFPQN